jgi:hypothetical protein
MRKLNKRLGRSRSGVSDIIGNLLILAITVTLFSSIMFYVASMPEPAQATFTDLEPSLSNVLDDDSIYINVTHKGGQTLNNWTTGIYIIVNGVLDHELHVYDGGLTGNWKTGDVWSYKLQLTGDLTSLYMMIIDKDTNSIVWQTDLLGGVSGIQLPPIIGERYTDPSPGMANRTLTVFVRVLDPNNDDIIDVHLDLSTLGLTSNLKMVKGSGTLWSVDMPTKALFNWDNRKIIIYATDDTGKSSSALMTLDVFPEYEGGDGGGGDGEFPNFERNNLQGFAIFEREDWEANKFDATNTNVFVRDTEDAVMVMISKIVVNTVGKNQVLVMNPNTKQAIPEVSSPAVIMNYYMFTAGYYVYNCTIDTSTLAGNYSISATITDSKSSPDTFIFNSWIYVLSGETSTSDFPTFMTYKDSAFSIPWTNFSVSDQLRNKIYVEVQTEKNGIYLIGSGNVEIRDFVWATQLKRSPATTSDTTTLNTWNGPVSNIWQISSSHGIYRFVINLANCTTGAEWVPMDNAYILRFDVFKTSGETFLLTKVIHIDAPITKYDIVAGLPNAGGGSWATQSSLFYYENDNSWLPPYIMETTSDRKAMNPDILVLKGGDVNGDGKGGTSLPLLVMAW